MKTELMAAGMASNVSILVNGRGMPLAVAVDGANLPDQILVAKTLGAIRIERPNPLVNRRIVCCFDKGYAREPVDTKVPAREPIAVECTSVVLHVVEVLSNAARYCGFSEGFRRQGTATAIIGAIERAK